MLASFSPFFALTPYQTGEWSGRLLGCILIFAGIYKCIQISRRPTTSAKCVLALGMVLAAWLLMVIGGMIRTGVEDAASGRILSILTVLAGLLVYLAAFILAIIGLVDYRAKTNVYRQGRSQAIWAIILSATLGVALVAGFIKGVIDSERLAGSSIQPIPDASTATTNVVTFEDRNFRFHPPGKPWVSVKPSTINKDSQFVLIRTGPQIYFMIIAEDLSGTVITNTDQYVDLAKARMEASTTSDTISGESPQMIGNLNGLLVKHNTVAKGLPLHFEQWFCITNGWAYQLVGWGNQKDSRDISRELLPLFRRFEIIDTTRAASSVRGFTTNFTSERYAYQVNVAGSSWGRFASLKKDFPRAEFGASAGDSCFAVVPVWLRGLEPDDEALNAGLVSPLNIEYPNEDLTGRESIKEGGLTGERFDFSRVSSGKTHRFVLKILQGHGCAYLVTAWTQRQGASANAILQDAMKRVTFLPDAHALSTNDSFSPKELTDQSLILNQCGLSYYSRGQYEKALALFQTALALNNTNVDVDFLKNSLLCLTQLGRAQEGLDILHAQKESVRAIPDVRSFLAYFQARCGQTNQALENYAAIFSGGYREDSDFTDYINILRDDRQYDRALSEVQKYQNESTSTDIRLLTATIYLDQDDYTNALKFLNSEHKKSPKNAKVTKMLGETFLDAERPNEALACGQELIANDPKSAPGYYLKGKSEMRLKWYRDAKASLEQAGKLAPSSENVQSDLTYVSGLLGQGNNSMLKNPVPPVELPEALTNTTDALPVAAGAAEYGAFYPRLVTAISYLPGKECKTTEYRWIRVLDQAGVGIFSTLDFSFDPVGEDIFVNALTVTDSTGNVISKGKVDDYFAVDDKTSTSASNKRTLNIPVAGLQPGSRIFVAVTRRQSGKLDVFPFLEHCFSRGLPVTESVLYLNGATNGLSVRATLGVSSEALPGGRKWQATEPLVARWEPLEPRNVSSYLPTVWLADAASTWSGVSSNYLASIAGKLETDDVFRDRARKIVAQMTNDSSKIIALSRFVQTNCTYKAIEFGRRGRIPNRPAEVLDHKYGDCKDHAVLLRQLLAAVNIPAELALIGDPSIVKDLPSLDQFNHVIVHVPGENDGAYLDTTDKGADFSVPVPAHLTGYDTFILDEHSPRIAHIPDAAEGSSFVDVHVRARLTNETSLIVDEDMEIHGTYAVFMRDFFQAIPASYQKSTAQRELLASGLEITKMTIDALNEPGTNLTLHLTYVAENGFHVSGERLSGNLRCGPERDYFDSTPVDHRRNPFELRYPLKLKSTIAFEIPAGWQVEPAQSTPAETDARFGTCRTITRHEEGRLNYEIECQRQVGSFSPGDYAAFRQTSATTISTLEPQVNLIRAAAKRQ